MANIRNCRFFNAVVLNTQTMSIDTNQIVWVEGNTISYVGSKEPEREVVWDRNIDCKGNLLMPGLKNAHTHSAMTFLRSKADDLPLNDWLHQLVFPAEAKLTPEDVYDFTRLAIMEYVSGGTTAIFDMYLFPESVARACMDSGMRCTLVSGLNDFSSSIDTIEELYQRYHGSDTLIDYQIGFHAEYTCKRELLEQVSQLAHDKKAPVFTHLCETENEVKDCISRNQMTPPKYLDSLGLFDYGGGIFHGVYVSEEDIDIIKNRGLYVVTNPASNLKLASGIAPIGKYLEKCIPIAIGTDGAASNNSLNMFREMYLVSCLAKVLAKDASAVTAGEVLKMACCNGALAMGNNKSCSITVGNLADMIIINMDAINFAPNHDIVNNLVFCAERSNVLLTMINGKICYENGEYSMGIEWEPLKESVMSRIKRIFC